MDGIKIVLDITFGRVLNPRSATGFRNRFQVANPTSRRWFSARKKTSPLKLRMDGGDTELRCRQISALTSP